MLNLRRINLAKNTAAAMSSVDCGASTGLAAEVGVITGKVKTSILSKALAALALDDCMVTRVRFV